MSRSQKMNLQDPVEAEYYDDLLGRGAGDPDNRVYQVKVETEMHWTEKQRLGYKAPKPKVYPEGDRLNCEQDWS
jgi:hypothetical protein